MNKSDIKLILTIAAFSLLLLLIINILPHEKANLALVYYNNEQIKTINLNENNTYTVKGDNGEVKIEVKNQKIRVTSENSPKHLCSKQGWIDNTNQSIVCLPNKIVIKIDAQTNIDAIVK